MPESYDIAIIGGGPGGYVAAIRAAQLGVRVAIVEKDRLGGTCLNRGCIPSKAMVRDAEVYRDAASGAYCVEAEGPFRANFARLVQRRREVVDTLVQGVEHLMASKQIQVYTGLGRIVRPGLIKVAGPAGEQEIASRAIVIATGSVPARLPIPGADLPGVVSSDGLFALEGLPKSMVVVGASVVGIEFACIFEALGARISVLGRKTFLKEAEQQLAKRLRTMLVQRGMGITIGLEFKEIVRTADGLLRVCYEQGGKAQYAEGEVVLISTGRWPYTEGLGLDALGVKMNGREVAVDEHLQTSIPGIYAVGDCIGGYMLAHVASYEGEVAVENILGRGRVVDYRVVPNCIFTMPEIADVGLTEAKAKEAGLDVQVSRFPFNVNGRAVAMGETEGQVRMICEKGADSRGGKVLGVHIMGPHASDLIAEAALAMRLGATAQDIAETIHAHPTVPEAMMEAAMAQLEGAIHYEHR
jgi:dihydrolipoamide dehydrogenase